jgi:hypothetical protein
MGPNITHTEIWLLAALYHASTQQPVTEGKTLAHALGGQGLRPWCEWTELPATVQDGRRRTACGLLERYHIGEPFPDFGTDPVSDLELAEAIHDAERKAVEQGQALVNLGRPWTPFAELPEIAREGRIMQARYLKARAFFAPRELDEFAVAEATAGRTRGYMGSTPDGGIDDGDRDTLKPGDTGAGKIVKG